MKKSRKAKHGRSKEKRKDARLISLAMVVDHLGFPKYSRFYEGNVSEPQTLLDLLKEMKQKTGNQDTRPIVVIDAGIATTENLAKLREAGYDYIAVSRSKLRSYEVAQGSTTELVNQQGHSISLKDLACEIDTKDRLIYVKSPFKAKKETAIKDKLTQRFFTDLQADKAALNKRRGTKKIERVHQRIGRIKQKHSRVAKHYHILLKEDPQKGIITDLNWEYRPPNHPEEGVYFIQTSLQELNEKRIWKLYATLTEVESAFRTLKTDLSIRPVYHQTHQHIEAHLFLGVLAYYIVAIIRCQLKQKGLKYSWRELVRIMDSQKIISNTFMDKQGQRRFIRQCSKPSQQAREV